MVRSEIRSIAELKGKKLAVGGFDGGSHQRLLVIVSKAGLNSSTDVTILSVGAARLRLKQLRAGAIDATVLTVPILLWPKAPVFVVWALYPMSWRRRPIDDYLDLDRPSIQLDLVPNSRVPTFSDPNFCTESLRRYETLQCSPRRQDQRWFDRLSELGYRRVR